MPAGRGAHAWTSAAIPPGRTEFAVRFHGLGFITFDCGGSRWSYKTYFDIGFRVFPSSFQAPCTIEVEASWQWAPPWFDKDREWHASVAIYLKEM
jgi:hypothetical protein